MDAIRVHYHHAAAPYCPRQAETDVCVLAAAIEAVDFGYRVISADEILACWPCTVGGELFGAWDSM